MSWFYCTLSHCQPLKVYLCQLKTQFAQIEVHDEKPDYTMGQMLRDGVL